MRGRVNLGRRLQEQSLTGFGHLPFSEDLGVLQVILQGSSTVCVTELLW